MTSWREVAAQRVGEAVESAAPPFYGLDGEIAKHLRNLSRMPAPVGVNRTIWAAVVDDAIALARGGWVAAALALGWNALDLFGVGRHDSWEFSGLAVWLRGRTVVALDEHIAFASDAERRAVFHRGGWGHGKDAGLSAPVALWNLGRG